MKYDIVKELNQESERRLMAPIYWAIFLINIGIAATVKLVLVFADLIDAGFYWVQKNHPVSFGLAFVFIPLALLIRREIKRV